MINPSHNLHCALFSYKNICKAPPKLHSVHPWVKCDLVYQQALFLVDPPNELYSASKLRISSEAICISAGLVGISWLGTAPSVPVADIFHTEREAFSNNWLSVNIHFVLFSATALVFVSLFPSHACSACHIIHLRKS